MCIYLCGYICVDSCMHTHGIQRLTLDVFISVHLGFSWGECFCLFWHRVSWWSWSSPDWLDWLARKLQGSSVSALFLPYPNPAHIITIPGSLVLGSLALSTPFLDAPRASGVGIVLWIYELGLSASWSVVSILTGCKDSCNLYNPLQYFKTYSESIIWKMKCFVYIVIIEEFKFLLLGNTVR